MRRWLLLVQSLALSAVLMCPEPGGLGVRAIGSPDGDVAKHLWTLWWSRRELLSGEPGLLTRLVNFPYGARLYPIDPLDALIGILVPLPPVALANVLAFVHLALLGLCAGWLGRLVSGSRLGGYVAGALAQGSAFAAFTLHVGVGELRQFWWVPLGLGCLLRAHETGRWRWYLTLGAVSGSATLACFYHGAMLGLTAVAWLLFSLPRTRRAFAGLGLALAVALTVALPAARAFADTYGGGGAVEVVLPAADDDNAAAAPEDLYLPRAWARNELDAEARAYTGGRYLGFVAVGLALAGLFAAPRRALPWVGVGVAGTVLSFGSVPPHGLTSLVPAGAMPFALLDRVLAWLAEPVNFPARFLGMTMIALPVLGSLATRWRWTALLVPVAIIEVQAGDLVPWPRETLSMPPVRGLAGTGAILDLGLALDDSRASRLLDMSVQMALSSPTQAVPIDRLDRWNNAGARWARALPLTSALATRSPLPPDLLDAFRPDLALLADAGFERILLTHPTDGLDPQYDGVLTALCGQPQRTELATLWTLPAVRFEAAELAAWKADQAARVGALPETDSPGHYPTAPALR